MKYEIELRNFKVDGKAVYTLSFLEADIINELLKKPNEPIPAQDLADEAGTTVKTLRTQMTLIRRNYPLIKEHLRTVWGYGYMWFEKTT